ncbi:MAG: hypothetical protein JRH18_06395 [Deltaproteobacteria bacterium]|nr:hypothetical protein [Deltaproteobacteria bacterium]MBW1993941.1 hypothetical protein [Deltaproteobacteria bacterium]MBW2151282.1 hypothetical protein [Deltaproteobacteria bacterium]
MDDFLSVAMPARNLGIAEADGFSEMIVPCSACYSRMMVVQKQLEYDIALKREINLELTKKIQGKEGIAK